MESVYWEELQSTISVTTIKIESSQIQTYLECAIKTDRSIIPLIFGGVVASEVDIFFHKFQIQLGGSKYV